MTRIKRAMRRAVAVADIGAAVLKRDLARLLIGIGDLRHG